jgi:phage-related protein
VGIPFDRNLATNSGRILQTYRGNGGLYEIRVKHSNNIFRIFCFFDDGKLIVLANGFQKKTDKTPKQEIERALAIKAAYEAEKIISPTNNK